MPDKKIKKMVDRIEKNTKTVAFEQKTAKHAAQAAPILGGMTLDKYEKARARVQEHFEGKDIFSSSDLGHTTPTSTSGNIQIEGMTRDKYEKARARVQAHFEGKDIFSSSGLNAPKSTPGNIRMGTGTFQHTRTKLQKHLEGNSTRDLEMNPEKFRQIKAKLQQHLEGKDTE